MEKIDEMIRLHVDDRFVFTKIISLNYNFKLIEAMSSIKE